MGSPDFLALHPEVVETVSLNTTNVDLMAVLEGKSGDQQSQWHSSSGNQNLMAIHLIVVKTFQCGPEWSNRPTGRRSHPYSQAPSVAKTVLI